MVSLRERAITLPPGLELPFVRSHGFWVNRPDKRFAMEP